MITSQLHIYQNFRVWFRPDAEYPKLECENCFLAMGWNSTWFIEIRAMIPFIELLFENVKVIHLEELYFSYFFSGRETLEV